MGVASPRRATQGSRMTPAEERVRVAVEGDGNHAAVAYEGRAVRLEVFSARGMGRAAVEISPEAWPASLTLRLHLGGLESFRFHFDPHTVGVSVSSAGEHRVSETLDEGTPGATGVLAPDSAYWMAVARTPHPDDRLRALYFDVDAPAVLLNGAPRPFAFEWLDFYR